jgi:enamine deaminase RidA (YjgF/YER057c/UK114 family)
LKTANDHPTITAQEELFFHLAPAINKTDFENIKKQIAEKNATVIRQVVFGSEEYYKEILNVQKVSLGEIMWPCVWIPSNSNKSPLADGVFFHAITNTDLEYLTFNGDPIGCSYKTDFAEVCYINGLQPNDFSLSRKEQAHDIFKNIQALLTNVDMELTDIVRTWFYNDDILNWYDDFNKVRTAFYQESGVYENRIPASTGVGVFHPLSTACTVHLVAMKPLDSNLTIETVASPLQCSATSYGSSFSRATQVKTPTGRKLFVSGTASINEAGETVYLDDLEGQIIKTYQVINEILESCGMTYQDVESGIIYLKQYSDIPEFKNIAQKHSLPQFPSIITENIVCRDNLLFEIEVEARID